MSIKIAFVCLGNICRSPMAELIFKSLAERRGVADKFFVTSFGTSDDEEGNGIYPPAREELLRHGIVGEHRARHITLEDMKQLDYIVAAETSVVRSLLHISYGMYSDKIVRMCDFTDKPRDVSDPWYTRDFARAYEDIEEGCAALLDHLVEKHK